MGRSMDARLIKIFKLPTFTFAICSDASVCLLNRG